MTSELDLAAALDALHRARSRMRKAGATRADAIPAARDTLTALAADARERETQLEATRAQLAAAIIDSMRVGIPVAEIASITGLSRARIYQIRDGRR